MIDKKATLPVGIFNAEVSTPEIVLLAILDSPMNLQEISFRLMRCEQVVRKYLRGLQQKGYVSVTYGERKQPIFSRELHSIEGLHFEYPIFSIRILGSLDMAYFLLCLFSIKAGSDFGLWSEDYQVIINPKPFAFKIGDSFSKITTLLTEGESKGFFSVERHPTQDVTVSLQALWHIPPIKTMEETELQVQRSLFCDPIYTVDGHPVGFGPSYRLVRGLRYYLESLEAFLEDACVSLYGGERSLVLPQALLYPERTVLEYQNYVILYRNRPFLLGPRVVMQGYVHAEEVVELYRPSSAPIYQYSESIELPKVYAATVADRVVTLWNAFYEILGPIYYVGVSKQSFSKAFMPWPKKGRQAARKQFLMKVLDVIDDTSSSISEFVTFASELPNIKTRTLNTYTRDWFLENFKLWKTNYPILLKIYTALKERYPTLNKKDPIFLKLLKSGIINAHTVDAFIAFVLSQRSLPIYAIASTVFLDRFKGSMSLVGVSVSTESAPDTFLTQLRGFLYNAKSNLSTHLSSILQLFQEFTGINDPSLVSDTGQLTVKAVRYIRRMQLEGRISDVDISKFFASCLTSDAIEELNK